MVTKDERLDALRTCFQVEAVYNDGRMTEAEYVEACERFRAVVGDDYAEELATYCVQWRTSTDDMSRMANEPESLKAIDRDVRAELGDGVKEKLILVSVSSDDDDEYARLLAAIQNSPIVVEAEVRDGGLL